MRPGVMRMSNEHAIGFHLHTFLLYMSSFGRIPYRDTSTLLLLLLFSAKTCVLLLPIFHLTETPKCSYAHA
jgi:hypothetical protein